MFRCTSANVALRLVSLCRLALAARNSTRALSFRRPSKTRSYAITRLRTSGLASCQVET